VPLWSRAFAIWRAGLGGIPLVQTSKQETHSMSFLSNLESHLNLIPTIVQAVQAFQAIGHSKETTVQKIGQIIEVTAALGEAVPLPIVAAISATVESIAEQIFNPAPAATTSTTAKPMPTPSTS
jgi:hypothetical protein